jgi:F1F0 ATPase subunit 2
MNEVSILMMAVLAGAGLGAIFFGGLWWTIRSGFSSKTPALWFLGSLVLRTGIAVGGFYVVSDGDWHILLACLAGFLATRTSLTWLMRTPHASTP